MIRNRDVIGDDAIEKYLNGTIADLYDGMLMKDMDKAVAVLGEKIKENVKIRIIGDYDIDGIQSTYILLEGFRMLGADVDSDIPDRMKDGYGLNRNLIDRRWRPTWIRSLPVITGLRQQRRSPMQKVWE